MPTFLAVAPLLISATQAGMSFIQRGNFKRKSREAETMALANIEAAKKQNEKLEYSTMALDTRGYDRAYDNVIAASADATRALTESDRGIARIGAVQAGLNTATLDIQDKQAKEMLDIEKLKAQERQQRNQFERDLEIGLASRQFQEASNYEGLASEALEQGVKGVADMASAGVGLIDDYGTSGKMNRKTKRFQKQLDRAGQKQGLEKGEYSFSKYFQDIEGGLKDSQTAKIISSKIASNPTFKSKYEQIMQGSLSDLEVEDFIYSNFEPNEIDILRKEIYTN
tara:strand:- start:11818 stop:12666 length:849 start_codon:yes stop_codon:yes gene_type:complete